MTDRWPKDRSPKPRPKSTSKRAHKFFKNCEHHVALTQLNFPKNAGAYHRFKLTTPTAAGVSIILQFNEITSPDRKLNQFLALRVK